MAKKATSERVVSDDTVAQDIVGNPNPIVRDYAIDLRDARRKLASVRDLIDAWKARETDRHFLGTCAAELEAAIGAKL